jgi:probable HAF family extracellular repeat protein
MMSHLAMQLSRLQSVPMLKPHISPTLLTVLLIPTLCVCSLPEGAVSQVTVQLRHENYSVQQLDFKANAINDSGEVVGWTGDGRAVLYRNGIVSNLGALPGHNISVATDINNSGQVVGASASSSLLDSQRAFLYAGGMTDLGVLPPTDNLYVSSAAVGLNNSGQVVGSSYSHRFGGITHAFLYSSNGMTDLGTLPGQISTLAFAINSSGQIIGESGNRAFLYSNGLMIDLGLVHVSDINASGQIVGRNGNGAFLYRNGATTMLGTIPGGISSAAYGINDLGQVVGTSYHPASGSRAFLYDNGVMTDLNSLIPSSSGWVLGEADDINNAGQIIGSGTINGQGSWFLLTPQSGGCNAHLSTTEQQITVNPGGSKTIKVQVTDCLGGISNSTVQVKDEDHSTVPLVEQGTSDGHSETVHNGARPKGSFAQPMPGPEPGSFLLAYSPPLVSGLIRATVRCATPDGRPCTPIQIEVKVKVNGLEELGPGANYELVGDNNFHPENHYGIPDFNSALQSLAGDYAAKYPGSKLAYNDMSLAFGGVFDLNRSWNSILGHAEHRLGINADLCMVLGPSCTREVPPERRLQLWTMLKGLNVGVLVEKPGAQGFHWHLRYGQPNCNVKTAPKQVVPCDQYPKPLAAEIQVQAIAQVSYDPNTRLYAYQYSFVNDPTSSLELSGIEVPLNDSVIVGLQAPLRWTATLWDDSAAVDFTATDIVNLPPNYVEDGNLLPSPYQIRPGQSLGGFSFQSPYPPGTVDLFAQGFKPLPSIVDDGGPQPNYFDGSFKGTTTGPVFPSALYSNKIDEPWAFVRQHYRDFLNREPDAGGLVYWAGQILQCGSNPTCLHNKRVAVSNAFFFEQEYQQTGAYVYRLYREAFGNNQPFPNPDGSNQNEANKLPSYPVFARDRARVVGGTDLAQGQLDLANAFVGRPEFVARYPNSLTGLQFVDALLAMLQTDIGVDLTSQRTALIDLFNSSGRGAVVYRLADDNVANPINNRAFIDAEYNRAFVATQYFGYLRRDSDIGGFLFWLGQVNSGLLRDGTKQHGMVCSFITSAEYQLRFSSAVTHTNAECPQ